MANELFTEITYADELNEDVQDVDYDEDLDEYYEDGFSQNLIDFEESVDLFLEELDVNKIQNVMNFLNWKWVFNGNLRPPTQAEIVEAAKDLLMTAWEELVSTDDPFVELNSGGLHVILFRTEEMVVNFVIESINNF